MSGSACPRRTIRISDWRIGLLNLLDCGLVDFHGVLRPSRRSAPRMAWQVFIQQPPCDLCSTSFADTTLVPLCSDPLRNFRHVAIARRAQSLNCAASRPIRKPVGLQEAAHQTAQCARLLRPMGCRGLLRIVRRLCFDLASHLAHICIQPWDDHCVDC
jgi:hypothetical protein